MCFFSYSQSAEFVSVCYDFDIAVNICTIRDIQRKISDHFSCVVNRNQCFSVVVFTAMFLACFFTYFLLYCMYVCVCTVLPVMANKLHHFFNCCRT